MDRQLAAAKRTVLFAKVARALKQGTNKEDVVREFGPKFREIPLSGKPSLVEPTDAEFIDRSWTSLDKYVNTPGRQVNEDLMAAYQTIKPLIVNFSSKAKVRPTDFDLKAEIQDILAELM